MQDVKNHPLPITHGSRMALRLLQILTMAAVSFVAGCKVTVIVPPNGDVTSATGTRDCAGGKLCEFNVTDKTFTESFTAAAKQGYKFKQWKSGPGFLCGASKDPTCKVDNSQTPQGNAAIDDFIEGGGSFYAMPVFEQIANNAPHPVGNSGKVAKETVGERQKLGKFGQAVTRARYPESQL